MWFPFVFAVENIGGISENPELAFAPKRNVSKIFYNEEFRRGFQLSRNLKEASESTFPEWKQMRKVLV